MCFEIEQYEVLNVNHIKGVHPENRVIGFVLLAIRPPELGKTTNTTFTTSNNDANDTRLRRDISPGQLAGNVSKAKRCS